MLDTAGKAVAQAGGVTRDLSEREEILRLALTHLVQVVGEAGRHASREFCDDHPEISWQGIRGMRHDVVHDYMGVDEDTVWQVVTEEVPPPSRISRLYIGRWLESPRRVPVAAADRVRAFFLPPTAS
jgi:uncharacterized protein with HEPN domain